MSEVVLLGSVGKKSTNVLEIALLDINNFATERTSFVVVHCDLVQEDLDTFDEADILVQSDLVIL